MSQPCNLNNVKHVKHWGFDIFLSKLAFKSCSFEKKLIPKFGTCGLGVKNFVELYYKLMEIQSS
jgi:hypothetical protein